MLLALSAIAAVVLLLLALRLTQRLTLRFKLLAGVSVSRQPQKSCPHLGASADPFTHEHQPSEDHRCYLWMQRDRIDLAHQKGFCLTTAHHKCPWLMIRHPNATPPLSKRLPRLVLGLPRTVWGGLRLAPGLVLSAVAAMRRPAKPSIPLPSQWERLGEGTPSPASRRAGEGWSQPSTPSPASRRAGEGWSQPSTPSPASRRAGEGWSQPSTPSPASRRAGEGWSQPSTPSPASRRAGEGWSQPSTPSPAAAGEGWGEGARRLAQRAFVAFGKAAEAGGPRLATGAARVAAGLLIAAAWSGRMLWRLCLLLARGIRWLAPRVARGAVWSARRLARVAADRRQARVEQVAPSPQPSPVATGEGVLASLGGIEELLAEGLATLDRGQEGLAYHIFAKATEQRAPRGAGEAYQDAMKRAWFWRAETAETIDDVVLSLEKALQYEPGNLQMQAHLAWAHQRLERERKLMPIEQATPAAAAEPLAAQPRWRSLGVGVRMAGGLMALALAGLWMTTAVMPAFGRSLAQLPAGDELLLRRLILTLNAAALPGQGHLPLPMVHYDLGLALPFVMAFAFVFTARGLMDGDSWARTTGLLFAGVGGWLCAVAVSNPDASHLGLALCVGIIVATVAGRFDSPRVVPQGWVSY